MQPEIELDEEILVENARAWRAFCGPLSFYAVVKADAYRWGVARVAGLLEPFADAFCVADVDELRDLRRSSAKLAIVMSRATESDLPYVLANNALPTMESAHEIRAGIGAGRVRLGLRPAAAWSGSSMDELRELAPLIAQSGTPVELWTHITAPAAQDEQVSAFESALAELRAAGVRIAGSDAASTFPLVRGCRAGTAVRVGIGLFGAGASSVPGVRCALRVRAPVVKAQDHAAGTRVGYGGMMLAAADRILTARCGYADGLPNTLEGWDDILTVGMQYVTVRGVRAAQAGDGVSLIDPATDLDALAASCGRLPHEIVTALGNAAH